MKRSRECALTIAVGAVIFSLAAAPAQAYVDPGTGSMLMQVVAAALFGSLFAIRVFWRRICELFRRTPLRGKSDHPGHGADDAP